MGYDTTTTGNCGHNLTPSQINIKPHTKGLPTSVPSYTIHHVQLSTKLQFIKKKEQNKNLKKQQCKYSKSERDSGKADILVLSDKEFK